MVVSLQTMDSTCPARQHMRCSSTQQGSLSKVVGVSSTCRSRHNCRGKAAGVAIGRHRNTVHDLVARECLLWIMGYNMPVLRAARSLR